MAKWVTGYYIMHGLLVQDGPFDTQDAAIELLKTKEELAQYVGYFDGKEMKAVKAEDNQVINGHTVKRMLLEQTSDDMPNYV